MATVQRMSDHRLPPVVSPSWLADNADDVVICDVRMLTEPDLARRRFEEAHLPGARLVDLDRDLAAPAAAQLGRHPLPTPEAFADTLARLGIAGDAGIVAYDDANGALAARLVWMLRALGDDAALLDGGSAAWEGPLDHGPVSLAPVERRVRPWPRGLLADADDVRSAIDQGLPVIDSRSAERFRGEIEPIDAVAGHIPGAVNLPFVRHFEPAGRLRSADDITGAFLSIGVPSLDDGPIVYCGSGVTACVNLLAAEHSGLGAGRLYVGSWSGWSTTEGLPVATGDGSSPF